MIGGDSCSANYEKDLAMTQVDGGHQQEGLKHEREVDSFFF